MEQILRDEKKLTFEETKNQVKELMKKLSGKACMENLDKIKTEFKDIIAVANPLVIAMAENELVKEGYSQDDLMNACDIHLLLFKDAIENPNLKVPDWHPIHRFQEEHRFILKIMEELRFAVIRAKQKAGYNEAEEELIIIRKFAQRLMEAENHNVRQENTLFPVLEKHGIEQPPAIMWAEHTEMKEQKKEILRLLDKNNGMTYSELLRVLENTVTRLLEKFSVHTQKEEHILYVTALKVIPDEEWKEIKEECDNLGYFDLK